MKNQLAKNFTAGGLLRFAAPTIAMMVFMSLYTMVDGVFVSRFIGTTALSAVNIVYPLINLVMAIGIMLATGASAVVATRMGEGETHKARQNFTFIVLVGIAIGLAITLLGFLFIGPMLRLMGAGGAVWQYCYDYAHMLLWFTVPSILQLLFQYFFVVAGRPSLGLAVTVLGGLANIVLDYIFIVPLGMGIAGAALATGIGYSIPGLFGLWYFFASRGGSLHFVRPRFDDRMLLKTCTNGASEMVTNLSLAITTLLFNLLMMEYLGEDGVAAVTIVLYAQYLLVSVYLGYSSGVAPVFSYKHGAGDTGGLQQVFKTSMLVIMGSSVAVFAAALLLRGHIALVFAPAASPVYGLAVQGLTLFSVSFLFTGLNIFASAMFTALSNGRVSAVLSFLRTFLFLVACLAVLPALLGVDGIWLAVPAAELLAVAVSAGFMLAKRRVYRYA